MQCDAARRQAKPTDRLCSIPGGDEGVDGRCALLPAMEAFISCARLCTVNHARSQRFGADANSFILRLSTTIAEKQWVMISAHTKRPQSRAPWQPCAVLIPR